MLIHNIRRAGLIALGCVVSLAVIGCAGSSSQQIDPAESHASFERTSKGGRESNLRVEAEFPAIPQTRDEEFSATDEDGTEVVYRIRIRNPEN